MDSALHYFTKAEEFAKRRNMERDWAMSLYKKATVYASRNLYDKANATLQIAWNTFDELDYADGMAKVKIEQAQLAAYENKPVVAVNFYLEGITLAKEAGNKNSEALAYNNLANVFADQKQYHKAIEYYELALGIVTELHFKPGISACFANLGATYSTLKQNDRAIPYLNKAWNLKEETGDILGAGRVLRTLGQVYQDKKDYQQAELSYQQAFEFAMEVGNIQDASKAEFGLAQIGYYLNDFGKSISLAENVIANLEVAQDLELIADAHQLLAQAYQKENELGKALAHSNKYIVLTDSLYNNSIISISRDLEAKYQNEQNAQEIALLASERDLQEVQLQNRINERNGIIAFALVSVLIGGLLYNQYRIKQRTNIELRELDRVKSDFFANISHEFRTPLTLIKGPIEQMEQQPDLAVEKDTIKMIRRNTNKLLQLVNQLLDLSRIDKGSLRLNPTEGDVYKCLRVAASSFNSHAAHRNINYRVDIPTDVLWASLDREKLEVILYNLIGNAFKFSEDKSTISISAIYDGSELQIVINDSGKGIPDEKIPFIFDRFYQVDSSSSREKEGSGIGLALTKELIALMDGSITVKSEIGRGSSFRIHIPVQKIKNGMGNQIEQYQNPEPELFSQPIEIREYDHRPLETILVVEDNRDMRQFIRTHLIHTYRVLEARDGLEGKDIALSLSPELIITDLMMPGLDGIELCQILKSDIHTSHIPVIMLTAKAGIDNKLKGLETGADDYLIKPFNARELQVRVRNLILQRKKLRDHYGQRTFQIDPKEITANSLDEKFVKQLLDTLEIQYANPEFSARQLQQTLNMSRMQLHRKLKALTNEAPGELIRNFRLKRAEQLLAKKTDTVTQIAYSVGFNNISYFAKCFKEYYGVVPSKYKI
jgi:signal transduction histidine kinase/DNA-binding response OmpR family regulator